VLYVPIERRLPVLVSASGALGRTEADLFVPLRFTRLLGVLLAAVCWCGASACAPPSPREPSSEEGPTDWNAGQIRWRDYDAGLADARAEGKPIVLIFYTDWCPHCHNYSRVFFDPELAALTSSFVMIRVERDSHPELSARYDVDGEYIPRTFFLKSNGELRVELAGDNPEYRYFLDEDEPSELIALMQLAVGR
jgi:protein-disulfide reductase (glutathione)